MHKLLMEEERKCADYRSRCEGLQRRNDPLIVRREWEENKRKRRSTSSVKNELSEMHKDSGPEKPNECKQQ
ncbi:hypothetical protein PFISCL1PPCAC_6644 [Pristionchus fissidentatus]|uniref:Uncharacterized protein n=1 Tax=Pristionchus fissidentatus TaxID=1538716 RepID=A0AAV5V970_9BILA|nr:hypothetical protein PFISCL1PPCAC_6644 [Pristionchus fissidentatus]